MATALDIIKGALRDVGAIAGGETPSSNESADALSALNNLIESWSAEGYLIYGNAIEEFSLTIAQQSYTIGSGANFNTDRPIQINKVMAKVVGQDEQIPVRLIDEIEWARITDKTSTSSITSKLYYNPTYPNGTIYVWPVPSAASKLVLYSMKPISTFALTSTTVSFPPGYERALRKNLAVELSPEYGRAVSADLQRQALESLASVKRRNIRPTLMDNDAPTVERSLPFNYLTGE